MSTKTKTVDWGGLTLKVNQVEVGVSGPGSSGTVLDGTELAALNGAPYTVDIAYAASATTDGIEATYTVQDVDGDTLTGDFVLECWVSDQTDGIGLTGTAASGALTAAAGAIHTAHTAKKHVTAVAEDGVLTLLLVDSANTADEYFCCKHPVTGAVIVGPATAAGDYEGGS